MRSSLFALASLTLLAGPAAADPDALEPIDTTMSGDAESPIGTPEHPWGVLATFPAPAALSAIQVLDLFPDGDVLIVDGEANAWRLDADDYAQVVWRAPLPSDRVFRLAVAPDGARFAVTYEGVSRQPQVEIRGGADGEVLHEITVPLNGDCGVDGGFLQPWDLAWGAATRLAVFFANSGANTGDCVALSAAQMVLIDAAEGVIEAARDNFVADFWGAGATGAACGFYFPFDFSDDGQSLYVANCNGAIARYDVPSLELARVGQLGDAIMRILEDELQFALLRRSTELNAVYGTPGGDVLTIWGAQGEGVVMRADPDLRDLSLFTINQGAVFAHLSYSPDGRWFMANYEQLNLWSAESGLPVFYGRLWGANQLARFHPTRQAIVFAEDVDLKVLAPLPISEVEVSTAFTPTGHWINAWDGFCVRGAGPQLGSELVWAFGDYEIDDAYFTAEPLCAVGRAGRRAPTPYYNNDETVPAPAELRLKARAPTTVTVWGGSAQPLTAADRLRHLPPWAEGARAGGGDGGPEPLADAAGGLGCSIVPGPPSWPLSLLLLLLLLLWSGSTSIPACDRDTRGP